eukprot:maker-scaffold_36-snap-gene-1.6-mRNA-1 protein AED:0.00 eAED:0.00 QI:80/1/1/1/1/1/3/599/190
MDSKTFLLLYSFFTAALAYNNPNPQGCDGRSFCLEVSEGAEFAEIDENGTIASCLFGITSVGTDKACDHPCDGNFYFNCSCVSKSVAQEGLNVESEFSVLFATCSFLLLLPIIGIHVYRQKKYNQAVDAYLKEVESKEMNKVNLIPPNPPMQCCFYLIYIILISLGSVFAAFAADIRGQDYWTGCGEGEF